MLPLPATKTLSLNCQADRSEQEANKIFKINLRSRRRERALGSQEKEREWGGEGVPSPSSLPFLFQDFPKPLMHLLRKLYKSASEARNSNSALP